MVPDSKKHTPTPETVRALLERIGKSQAWVAERSGISERRLRYLIAGTRATPDKGVIPVEITYPEQFTLEALACACEQAREIGN